MERDFAGSRLSQEDFERLAARCSGDPKFPHSYEAWLRAVSHGESMTAAEGGTVRHFEINAAEFVDWCQRVGVVVCLDSLRAYLIINRRHAQAVQADSAAHSAAPESPKSGRSSAERASLLILIAGVLMPVAPSLVS